MEKEVRERMSVKRFLMTALVAVVTFIGGVLLGRFVLAPRIEIAVVDIDKVVNLVERYNVLGEEIKKEFKAIKEWNKETRTEEKIKSKEIKND